jgi:hypothetical protein
MRTTTAACLKRQALHSSVIFRSFSSSSAWWEGRSKNVVVFSSIPGLVSDLKNAIPTINFEDGDVHS